MGLDIGDKRIGVAVSDALGIIATPYTIVERSEESRDIASILDIAVREGASRIIAGLPLAPDGGLGQQAQKTDAFIRQLSDRTDIPVERRDESLTTAQARQIMLKTRSKKNRRASHDDDVAAAVLLQGYLDEKSEEHKTDFEE